MPSRSTAFAAFLILIQLAARVSPADSDEPPKERTVRTIRPDKKQPWLKATRFSVETAGRSPKVSIRFLNEHATRPVEEIKPLGSGTARDDYGHEYKAYSLRMIDSLQPREGHTAKYSLLPKLTSKSSTLLLLLQPVEERVVYVKLRLADEAWEIEEYGTWTEKTAYRNQNDWAADRKKENPYQEAAAVVREWSDTTGEFSVTASFVDFKIDKKTGKGVVYLKLADDGTTIDVDHQRLSAADQKYIRELKQKEREE